MQCFKNILKNPLIYCAVRKQERYFPTPNQFVDDKHYENLFENDIIEMFYYSTTEPTRSYFV